MVGAGLHLSMLGAPRQIGLTVLAVAVCIAQVPTQASVARGVAAIVGAPALVAVVVAFDARGEGRAEVERDDQLRLDSVRGVVQLAIKRQIKAGIAPTGCATRTG